MYEKKVIKELIREKKSLYIGQLLSYTWEDFKNRYKDKLIWYLKKKLIVRRKISYPNIIMRQNQELNKSSDSKREKKKENNKTE